MALAILVVAVILSTIIPPSQSPDEDSHLARAYLLSKGQILLDRDPAGSGGAIDDGLLAYTSLFHVVGTAGKLDSPLINGVAPYLRWTGTESRRDYAGTGYYLPVIYIPQAIALAIGRYLDLTIAHSYRLTRLAVFLSTAALVAVSLMMLTPSYATLALLALPMVVFQAVSTTIDGLSLALCMLAVTCFMMLLRGNHEPEDRRRFALLCLSVLILSSSRAHALPMVLLPFVVAWQKKSRPFFVVAAIVLICTLGWTLFALVAVKDNRIPREVSTAAILRYYTLRPWLFFQVLGDTLRDKWAFYRDSFIGMLGYLDVHLPQWYQRFAGLALLVLAALSIKPRNSFKGEGLGRATLTLIAVASCLLVFMALLATWTPFRNHVIDGVQGRYFHIPALLLAYALSGTPSERGGVLKGVSAGIFVVLLILSAYVSSTALLDRYWLQDRNYGSPVQATNDVHLPLILKAGDTLSGELLAPAKGKLRSVALSLGTYFGNADGVLSLKVCSDTCTVGWVDVAKANDNRFAYFWFEKALPVSRDTPLKFWVSMSTASTHPVVLWAHRSQNLPASSRLNEHDTGLMPELQIAIE